MHEEIGFAAGKIWHALDAGNELSLAQLKKAVGALHERASPQPNRTPARSS